MPYDPELRGNGCPVFKKCGGCQLQNLTYDAQLSYKQGRCIALLGRFGHVERIVGMDEPYHYRCKVQAGFARTRAGLVSGVFQSGSGRIVPVEGCMIEDEVCSEAVAHVRDTMRELGIRPWDGRTGSVRHVLVRRGLYTGELMAVIVTQTRQLPSKNAFVRRLLEKMPAITTVVQNVCADPLPLTLGRVNETLYGEGFIVDGLLGIGFRGALRPQYAQFIRSVNASGLPVAALDLPSGLDADTGRVAGEVIRAMLTITFGFPKPGLFLADGPRCRGMLRVVPIGLPLPCRDDASLMVYTAHDAAADLPQQGYDVHKFRRGSLLIAAGSRRYPGAAALTSRAALRSGAGIVRLLFPEGSRLPETPAALIRAELPATESGSFSSSSAAALTEEYRRCNALAAGPGWDDAAPEMLKAVLECPAPLILDADALNLAARHPELWRKRNAPTVITPHPGEALRLAEAFDVAAEPDRAAFAVSLARRLDAVTVLKGPQSVIAAPDGSTWLNTSGAPDLATAGSGDVLTGVIGALLSTGCDAARAVRLGVWIHGAAGEIGGAGLVADDLPLLVGQMLKFLRRRGEVY